ncbi:MAG: DUF3558 domain-containing protein [Gemmatimonadetes bacterium]|nr:DUF3558 domain-containing protein [Gemmatimonadota bacterium]
MRARSMTRSVPLLTALVVAAAGCGGGAAHGSSGTDTAASAAQSASASRGPSSFPDASLDPCSLLTVEELGAALGTKVNPGKADEHTGEGSRGCNWTTEAYDAGGSALVGHVGIVTLAVEGPNPALASRFPTARSFFDFTRTILQNPQPVSGVGDEAVLTGKGHDMWARKGNVVLRLFFSGGLGDMSELKPLTQLMTEALSRT